jgi:hypothetical protein
VTESAPPARAGRPASRAARSPGSAAGSPDDARGRGAPATSRPGTLSRIKNRRKAGPLYKTAMLVFTVGLLAICVDAVIFVTGVRPIPWWVHLITVLAPVGLGIGLIGTVHEARRERSD